MIKCDTCGLWHGNSQKAHLRPTPIVAPMSSPDPDHSEFWSWVYFHGKAEDHVLAYQDHLLLKGDIEQWQAPDLVRSNIPIEQVEDGKFKRVTFIDGTEMLLVLWSQEAEYKQDYETGVFMFKGRRRGLICLWDDEEAQDYAFKCYDERRNHL